MYSDDKHNPANPVDCHLFMNYESMMGLVAQCATHAAADRVTTLGFGLGEGFPTITRPAPRWTQGKRT